MRKIALLLAAIALGAAFSESASAHGSVSIGIGFGFPIWGPGPAYYAPPPAYYYPAPVVVSNPNPPVRYIERQNQNAAPASADWWYYCDQSRSYYPYVKTCPGGWQKVSPTPPG